MESYYIVTELFVLVAGKVQEHPGKGNVQEDPEDKGNGTIQGEH